MLLGLYKNLTFNSGKVYPYATGGDYVYLYEDTETGKTYRVHEFLSTGTSTLNVEVGGQMEYLIVAGGGGGGDRHGGGGGGGGFLSGSFSFNIQNYTITVGEGGTGGSYEANNTSPQGSGAPGSNSSISGVATSYGGGGGGTYDGNPSGTFGSGGGGGGNTRPGIAGTVGQGNSGGSGLNPGAGGGGGAGSVGGDANNGSGGDGKEWPVGSGKYYAGGGGGAWSTSSGPATPGGIGGGGAGAWNDATIESGSPNTGGGGGGSRSQTTSTVGRPGGSGIVIVRYVVAEKKLWTPSELTSLKAWWDAADETTIFDATSGGSLPNSGNDIARWEDKSGGGYHVTQATAANCPHYVTNTLNGKPVIECTSQWLTSGIVNDWKFLHDTTGSTVVAITKFGISSDPNATYGLLGNGADSFSTHGIQFQFDDRLSVPRNERFVVATSCGGVRSVVNQTADGDCTPNTPILISAITDPGNPIASQRSSIFIDGGTPITNNTLTNTTSTNNPTYALQIGAAGNNIIPLTGYIAEVVICNAIISNADRQKLEGYLAHKWGLTNNLPSGHPYKYEPPYKVEPEEIVTDGLVLNLDAGDYASYPRSGTTWYDISGNGLNGTLTNGPTYDSENKGSIVFDGVNDYVDMGNILNSVVAGTDKKFSISCFFNPGSTGNKALVSKLSDSNLGENQRQFSFLARDTGNGYKVTFVYYGTLTASSFRLLESTVELPPLNEWRQVTVTYDGSIDTNDGLDRVKMYFNGESVGTSMISSAGSLLDIPSGTARLGIGSSVNTGGTGSFYNFEGKIGDVLFYDKVLTTTEITQNFNALRGRYGI